MKICADYAVFIKWLTKFYSQNIYTSVKYQFEIINQFFNLEKTHFVK